MNSASAFVLCLWGCSSVTFPSQAETRTGAATAIEPIVSSVGGPAWLVGNCGVCSRDVLSMV